MIQCIMAMQEHEGRDANRAMAEEAYKRVRIQIQGGAG
jgi:hypothetical protein